MAIKINCINKDQGNHDNPYVAISRFGWVNPQNGDRGNISLEGLVSWMENKEGKAYVQESGKPKAYLGVRTSRHGNKYVQTYADGVWANNLLELNECPV